MASPPKKPIPSFTSIDGISAYIVHAKQIKTCRHCSCKLHTGRRCHETKHKTKTSNNTQQDTEQQKNTEKICDPAPREEKKQPLNITGINPSYDKGNPHQSTNEHEEEPDLIFDFNYVTDKQTFELPKNNVIKNIIRKNKFVKPGLNMWRTRSQINS